MAQITAPCPIKENLIVKIEISYSSLVLCVLRVEVGPTAQPVVAAIEGADVAYGVETGPAGETCDFKQWAACDWGIAISTYQCGPAVKILVALLCKEEGVAV